METDYYKQLIIITGSSGAGRTTAINVFEDIGFVGPKGDVNSDSFTNIIDIVDIVYTILDQDSVSEIYLWAGDMDFSNSLNKLSLKEMTSSDISFRDFSYEIFFSTLKCFARRPSLSLSIELKDTYLLGGKNSFFLM